MILLPIFGCYHTPFMTGIPWGEPGILLPPEHWGSERPYPRTAHRPPKKKKKGWRYLGVRRRAWEAETRGPRGRVGKDAGCLGTRRCQALGGSQRAESGGEALGHLSVDMGAPEAPAQRTGGPSLPPRCVRPCAELRGTVVTQRELHRPPGPPPVGVQEGGFLLSATRGYHVDSQVYWAGF